MPQTTIRFPSLLVLPTVMAGILLLAMTSVLAQTSVKNKIAYHGQTPTGVSEIFLMNPDGSGRINLTNSSAEDGPPLWSPDGTKIAYRQREFDGSWGIHVMNADGSGQKYLAKMLSYFSSGFSWSPDSTKLAFTGGVTGLEISIINADGTNLTMLTDDNDGNSYTGNSKNPSWSPDGSTIVFARLVHRGYDTLWTIFMMNADGSNQREIFNRDFVLEPYDNDNQFFWSPDGTKIAFGMQINAYSSTETSLYVMNADGSNLTRISNGAGFYGYAWSPNSEKIAYSGVSIVNADGSNRRVLSDFGMLPTWSSNGKKIVFASNDGSASRIYVMNADGSGQTRIATDSLYDGYPAWKPVTVCECDTLPRPQSQIVQSNWPTINNMDVNWTMQAEVTDNDGLVLRDIKLGSRYMAKQISVPYYTLETSAVAKQRGELKPDGSDASMRSRLVKYEVLKDDEKLVIEATYAVDQISQSCLEITQRYEFYKQGVGALGGRCEPSGTLPCSRWKPIVKYKFSGKGGEILESINIPQRQHLHIDNNTYNTVGLFKDCDRPPSCGLSSGTSLPGLVGFERKSNPLFDEWYDRAISNGRSANQWDNIHQTYSGIIDEPGISPGFSPEWHFIGGGCPECVHSHWRWGAVVQGAAFGNGNVLGLPFGSKQDLDFAIVRNHPGEEDPNDYTSLASNERIRHPATGYDSPLQTYDFTAPDEVVWWYAGTGRQSMDTFFGHGSFFGASDPNKQLYGGGTASRAASMQALAAPVSDGLSTIVAANLYVDGQTTVTSFDPNILAPLPAGYAPYNNLSYNIETEAKITGPHTVGFSVASVSDQTVFNNLRVFHAEQDQFEPDKVVWVDRTILSPDPKAPDFTNKTINAKTRLLGQFVVASLISPQPLNTAVADVAISSSHSPAQVIAGNDLTYSFNITNMGAQAATGIKLADSLPPNSDFVSVTSSQGSCTMTEGNVVCKLNTLDAAASALVTIVAKPTEGGLRFPPEGKVINNTANVRANEGDANLSNNTATESVTVLPNPNSAPTVSMTSPSMGNIFNGLANINVTANASDSDGTISKVEFFDNGTSIGIGTTSGSNQYSFVWNNVGFGNHSLIAVATDNGGRTNGSGAVNFVINGLASVSITSPATFAEFTSPASFTINADASDSGGSISKVDFYANGDLIGTGTATGTNQYSVTWSNAYSGSYALTAVATDSSGVATLSSPIRIFVNLRINTPPVVSVVNPASGSVFDAPANIILTANASDSNGSINRVDFYANGALIGNGAATGANQYGLTWNNVARGRYTITAVATDNEGAATTSAESIIRVTSPALLVTGSTTLNSSDSAVQSRLQALGYTVTVKDGATVASADAIGKAVVVISSTVSPTSVGTKFRTVTVPVVTWESGLYVNMGMVVNSTKNYGTTNNQTQVAVTNPSHPLAGGLSGTVAVIAPSGTLSWATPNANAASIATLAGSTSKVAIFGYVSGAAMPGLAAPARRVGLFMYDTTAASLTSNGWTLFDAAINWATGLAPVP